MARHLALNQEIVSSTLTCPTKHRRPQTNRSGVVWWQSTRFELLDDQPHPVGMNRSRVPPQPVLVQTILRLHGVTPATVATLARDEPRDNNLPVLTDSDAPPEIR